MRFVVAAAGLLAAALVAPFVLIVLIVTAAGGGGQFAAACVTDANLGPILATIRTLESGGDYRAEAARSTASGAYQFVDGTWDDYGGYPHAAHAPANIQDQKAATMVRTVLDSHDQQVLAVPVVWYLGHLPGEHSVEWDRVPVPGAGNILSPRQYQTRWLTEYDKQAQSDNPLMCTAAAGDYGPLPSHLNCATLRWGGYPNGEIPYSAMRYRPHSGYLHPDASASFDNLYAASRAVGLDVRGSGYRPASAGGATAGTSCHGLGLAIDVTPLVPGNRYPTTEAAFASAEFTWLCNNAESFGWITPRWAIPEGQLCGTVTGTGTGGHIGDRCCFLEPWHLEAAGTVVSLR